MPFSDYKSQRRDAHRGRKKRSRLAFLCFFSKKQRRLKKKPRTEERKTGDCRRNHRGEGTTEPRGLEGGWRE
jgi:hypothetical protein